MKLKAADLQDRSALRSLGIPQWPVVRLHVQSIVVSGHAKGEDMPAHKKVKRPRHIFKADDTEFGALFSLGRLRKTWRVLRRELRQLTLRDCVDWVDWAHTVEATLPQLRNEILDGSFQPVHPTRYELAKVKGAPRSMASLRVHDALVYRHLSDEILQRAQPGKVKGAFFSRSHTSMPVGRTYTFDPDDYARFFEIWLHFQQYRTRTLLNRPYKVLVTTDITNYFDSIQHDLLLEYLAPLGLPRKAVALLGRLLEVLKPLSGHSPNPRVGLPVDEIECSRQIAHAFLFEHDQRVVAAVGESNYVRWMDDQNIGARNESHARRIVNLLAKSLSSQRLTINAGKTKFLSPAEVATEFHLDTNEALNDWEKRWKGKFDSSRAAAAADLEAIWVTAKKLEDQGAWDKILKRFYGQAVRVRATFLDRRTLDDLITYPNLASRIFESLARQNRTSTLIDLFYRYARRGECLFEGVEAVFFDSLLLTEAGAADSKTIRLLCLSFIRDKIPRTSKRPSGRASAVLAYYWFGGGIQNLVSILSKIKGHSLPSEVGRAWLAVVAARAPQLLQDTMKALMGHPSDDVSRLALFLSDLIAGKDYELQPFASNRSRWPLKGHFFDARAWLVLEILSQCQSKWAKTRVRSEIKRFQPLVRTRQEQRVLFRIRRNVE